VVELGVAVVTWVFDEDNVADGVHEKFEPLLTFAESVAFPPAEQINPLLGSDEIKFRTV